MSVYSPYSVSPSVNAGRNMCDARSFTCVQNGGLSRNSFVIPPVGRTPAKMMISISPSHCVGIA